MPKALIAEDEPLLAEEIREELLRLWPTLEICAVAHDGHAALRAFDLHAPDVLFLDVQMPGIDGIALANLIGPRAHVVFVTAFDHFAVRAFDEGALDYLVKPLDPARLARAVQRVKDRIGQQPADIRARLARVQPDNAEPQTRLRWITVLHGRELRFITTDEICYLKADNKYVSVVTVAGESLISTPLKELLTRLDPTQFWQIHRATVVNVNEIRSVSRRIAGRMTLTLKQRTETLPVGPNYTHLFKQL